MDKVRRSNKHLARETEKENEEREIFNGRMAGDFQELKEDKTLKLRKPN